MASIQFGYINLDFNQWKWQAERTSRKESHICHCYSKQIFWRSVELLAEEAVKELQQVLSVSVNRNDIF